MSNYIPKEIYEFLPSIYVIVGGILTAAFDNRLGKVCSLILVATGVIVFNARINARSKLKNAL